MNLQKSQINQIKTQKFTTSKDYQLFKSQLAIERQKIQNSQSRNSRFIQDKNEFLAQMESFYLPIMKQVYNQNKDKLQGKIRPPQEIFKRQNRQIPIQIQQRRQTQMMRRQIQAKDMKIRDLVGKCNNLYNKLKNFVNEQEINIEMENIVDDNQKKIKRLQNLLRIKNEQVFFKIKVQASNLLQQFQVDKNQITGINQLENENSIFEFLISKLKLKLKDIKLKQRESTQQIQKDRVLQQKNEQTIHFLTETNEILKNSQARTKQKLQQMKIQWQNLYEKLSNKDRELQQKQNEIFKLKKMNEQGQNQLLKLNTNERQSNAQFEQYKRESQLNMRELRGLLTNYNLQKKNLITILQQKQDIIEQMSIRQKYGQQQYEKANRQYIRWKERYEWLEKQKQNKVKYYQQQLQQLTHQFNQYKNKYNQTQVDNMKSYIDKLSIDLQNYKMRVFQCQQQINYQNQSKVELQQSYYKKFQALQTQYLNKYQKSQQIKQQQFNEFVKLQQRSQMERLLQLQQKNKLKLQEYQALNKVKFFQIQKQYIQKFNQLNKQNYYLKDQIAQLKNKIDQKDKLITILYPSIKLQQNTHTN